MKMDAFLSFVAALGGILLGVFFRLKLMPPY
jgi:hypothetical protein